MKKQSIFITGTDTDVGKSVLSLMVMHYFFKKGLTPYYIKPFQTGCQSPLDTDSDAAFIYRHIPFLMKRDPGESVVYCLKSAKAPLLAANDENLTINLKRVYTFIEEKESTYSPTIIEGAGGLFVPVSQNECIIDMIIKTKAKPVIAARAGLGTINHCLLTIEALKRRGITDPGIVFIKHPNDQTPPDMIRENMSAVTSQSGINVAGVIPPINDFSHPDPAVLRMLDNLFE